MAFSIWQNNLHFCLFSRSSKNDADLLCDLSIWICIWHIQNHFVSAWCLLFWTFKCSGLSNADWLKKSKWQGHRRIEVLTKGMSVRTVHAESTDVILVVQCQLSSVKVKDGCSDHEPVNQWSHHQKGWFKIRFDTIRPCQTSLGCGWVHIQSFGASM